MFTKALWGHIHGTLLPRSDIANVDPPSLVGGLPRARGGSPADSQPPPSSPLPPSNDANVDPPSITDAFLGAGGGSLADIQPSSQLPPRKLTFTVTLPVGEFESDSDSQVDVDSSEDSLHSYIPLVPRGDALRAFRCFKGM
jgi:hypothetical protein